MGAVSGSSACAADGSSADVRGVMIGSATVGGSAVRSAGGATSSAAPATSCTTVVAVPRVPRVSGSVESVASVAFSTTAVAVVATPGNAEPTVPVAS